MKRIKIAVHSENECVLAQQALFAVGYSWPEQGKVILFTHAKFLYGEDDGKLSFGRSRDAFMYSGDYDPVELKDLLPEKPVMRLNFVQRLLSWASNKQR